MTRLAIAAVAVSFCCASAGAELAQAPRAPLSEDPLRDALAPRPVVRVALELTTVCHNRPLAVAGWCVKPDQPSVDRDGGVTVNADDDLELELTVPVVLAAGRYGFMIASPASVGKPDWKPSFGAVVEFGVPGVQSVRFRADRPGEFRFVEPHGGSMTGRFTVRP